MSAFVRTADPYGDLDVIDARAPRFNQATVGRVLPVLLERPGRHPGQMVGRTPYLQPVHLRAPGARPGLLLDVAIMESQPHSLTGAPLAAAAAGPQRREAVA